MAGRKGNDSAKNKEKQKEKTIANDLFDALNPNNMLNNAQRVLSSAVNVLEEEIAAGILAAKKIEKKVINVEDVRNNPENLLNRLRKDTHEVVDLVLDALIAISAQLNVISNNIGKEKEDSNSDPSSGTEKQNNTIAILQNDEPVKPGETAILYMNLADDKAKEPVKIQLQKSDLTGPSKQKISSRYIQIKPSSVVIKAGDNKEVSIHVKVPANCKAGHYNGLLTDAQNPLLKAIISIEVL